MKKTILPLLTGAFLTAGLLCTSCKGQVTINGENGTDTIVFNTDSIREININVQTNGTTSSKGVSSDSSTNNNEKDTPDTLSSSAADQL
ncbi:MAG: hypothetical protein IJP75_12320 [Bacteroidaceae bacterium]|nr:hypothetical protein [Bacteroidaceae bacterium]